MYETAPTTENQPAPNVNSAQAETRWPEGTRRASTWGQEITQHVWEIPADSVWPRALTGEGKESGGSQIVKNLVGYHELSFGPVLCSLYLP